MSLRGQGVAHGSDGEVQGAVEAAKEAAGGVTSGAVEEVQLGIGEPGGSQELTEQAALAGAFGEGTEAEALPVVGVEGAGDEVAEEEACRVARHGLGEEGGIR